MSDGQRIRFSASRLATWMHCPAQARFQYIDKLPGQQNAAATFGTCLHKGFEVYSLTRNLDAAISIFKDWWTHPEKHGIEPEIWHKGQTFGGYMAKGIQALKDLDQNKRWKNHTLIATEHPFLVPFGDRYELTGYVDLLEIARNSKGVDTLEITDVKSGRKPTNINLRSWVQGTVYAYASYQKEFWLGADGDPNFPPMVNGDWWWELTQDLDRTIIWWGVFQGGPLNAGPRDLPDFERLYHVCEQIERAIEAEVYVPNISGDTCGHCSYTQECRVPFDVAEQREVDVEII